MSETLEHPKEESLLGPTLTTVFIHALIPIGLGLFVVYRLDEYVTIFNSANVDLPTFTSTVIEFSQAARGNVGAFFAIIGILLAGDGLGYYLLRRYAERVWARLWWGFVFAVECAILAGVFRTIVLPAREIMDSVPK